jgi:hypothetical protein
LLLSFTVICKPNINRMDQIADVIGFLPLSRPIT